MVTRTLQHVHMHCTHLPLWLAVALITSYDYYAVPGGEALHLLDPVRDRIKGALRRNGGRQASAAPITAELQRLRHYSNRYTPCL